MSSVLVLMSTYNGEKYLREQIDSILNQVEVQVDLLVRDDGSKDSTCMILEDYMRQGYSVKYIRGINLGWKHSFWDLVNMADGHDYYAFSDQDDLWDEDKLIRAIRNIEKKKECPVIYCANQRFVDADNNIIPHTRKRVDISNFQFQDFLVWGNIFRGCTEVWNDMLQQYVRSKKIGFIDEPHDAMLMQLGLAVGEVMKDNSEVMSYRQHENNVLGTNYGFSYVMEKLRFMKTLLWGSENKVFSNRLRKIYEIVKDDITSDKRKYYEEVCHYDRSFISALRLALSHDYKKLTKGHRLLIMLRVF